MNKRLLISLAHPDDETFGSGGLIAKYVAEGVEVYYIVGTDGSRGTVAPEYLEKYGSVAAVRAAEMDCAAAALGLREVFKLGYKDSGMMGTPDNVDPECLWQADKNVIAQQIIQIIQQVQPQVVITFDPYGGYGHPDHIAMHHATTLAFYTTADPNHIANGMTVYRPQKLYYTSFPRGLLSLYIWRNRLRGRDPRKFGRNRDLNLLTIRDNLMPITTKIDIWDWLDAWDKAADCHASQGSPRRSTPRWQQKLFASYQGLTRVFPKHHRGEPIETDLFQGVHLA
jgi:LmbE family N-acetylglucosaminyl deacetylase